MALVSYSSAEADAALDAIGTSFASLRPRMMQVALHPPVTMRELNQSLILHAVLDDTSEPSIGQVAERMNVDASVASRLVADCIEAGLLSRRRSTHDGRRSALEATPAGHELHQKMNRQYRVAFEMITADWLVEERDALAVLLHKYSQAANSLTGDDDPPSPASEPAGSS